MHILLVPEAILNVFSSILADIAVMYECGNLRYLFSLQLMCFAFRFIL